MDEIVKIVKQNTTLTPKTGIILGTGFKAIKSLIKPDFCLDTSTIKNYPKVSVSGHSAEIVVGHLGQAEVILFSGRPHFYEGYSPKEITMPINIMHKLGVNTVVLTNASGAINKSYNAGEFALIKDHISNNLTNPLIGKDYKFVDMCNAYDKELRQKFLSLAKEEALKVHEGVYIYFSGPSFETPAEINFARTIGADMVGMSTVAETIVARRLGLKVLGVSYLSNPAASEENSLNHESFLNPDKADFIKVASIIEKLCINN